LVPANGSVHAPDVVQDVCFPSDKTKIAVITGDWDAIQQILSGLGLDYDVYDGMYNYTQTAALLSDLELMKTYDIIFTNCGANHAMIMALTPQAVTNLQLYVSAGGSLYSSDWAYVYAELPWPNAINFYGDPGPFANPKVGMKTTITGSVTNPGLAGFLGKTKVKIKFDLDAWVVINSVPPTTTTHIVGDVPQVGSNRPLMVTHTQGAGTVLYTTFHNEKQVTGDMVSILNFLVFEL
jgi:hypothetical protein